MMIDVLNTALQRQTKADFYDFKASLVYIAGARPVSYMVRLYLKQTNKQTKKYRYGLGT